ncbi:MAG: DMP19 family protein [Candidatus Acidiferrum sp.]
MSAEYLVPRDDLSSVADVDLFWAVVKPMWNDLDFYGHPRKANEFFEKASASQGAMIAIWWCRSEVCNGGFDQFFWNSTGMIWPQALNGFRLVGADSYAALLADALKMFPGSIAPLNRNERDQALESNSDRMSVFDPIDEAFFALERDTDRNLDCICAKYIRSHPAEFFKD